MRSLLKRSVRFVCRNAFQNTRFFLSYALHYFDEGYATHAKFMEREDLVRSIEAGKSLIRLGDGEIAIINYASIHYQNYDPRLRKYLLAIISDYHDVSPYVLGIPQSYLHMSNIELRTIGLFTCWLPLKVTFRQRFPKRTSYFDAHLFYRNDSFIQVLERSLLNKRVLVVTSPENWSLMQTGGIMEKLSVEHIACLAQNSFTEFDSLLTQIRQAIPEGQENAYRVLISAGPMSKALVYTLCKVGILSYDLGKGIETAYRPNSIETLI